MHSLLRWIGAGLLLLLLMLAAHAERTQDVANQPSGHLTGSPDRRHVDALASPESPCFYSLAALAPTREGRCPAGVSVRR